MSRMCGALVAVATLALAGCSSGAGVPATASPPALPVSSSTAPTTLTVTGTIDTPLLFQLYKPKKKGDPCVADEGYGDIQLGAQVLILDGSNNKLSVGSVGNGTTSDSDGTRCSFPFLVPQVPPGLPIYSLQVGNLARGSLTYRPDDLAEPLALTLG